MVVLVVEVTDIEKPGEIMKAKKVMEEIAKVRNALL